MKTHFKMLLIFIVALSQSINFFGQEHGSTYAKFKKSELFELKQFIENTAQFEDKKSEKNLFESEISVAQRNKFVIPDDIFGSRVFIKNNGQYDKLPKINDNIEFAYNNEDENVFFSAKGLTYLIKKRHKLTHEQEEAIEHNEKIVFKTIDSFYVHVAWENSNPNIKIIESEKQNNYFSYGDYKADCFKKITYLSVYNNIDIEYVFTDDKKDGIKYNVILHPGANINDIKIKYSGDLKGVKIKDGNIVVKTLSQNVIEHAPISFQNNAQLSTNFTLNNNVIGFNIPSGYDQNSVLVIDPWVSNLSIGANNYGYDVDYDYLGNYFVYGGSSNFKVSKYTAAGALAWTFAGSVASQAWTTGSIYAGNFLCEKTTGKTYVGNIDFAGVGIIRLDISGLYDNFISITNTQWQELWDMGYNCATGEVYGFGGAVPGNVSAGILNTSTGALFPQNFTGLGTWSQDVVSHAFDASGTLFFIFASLVGTPSLDNKIMRVNSTFNGNVWLQPSTYTSMSEFANKGSYVGAGTNSNGFNCLAANANFLFYYDGLNLAAYDKTTGAKIGFTTITGNVLKRYGGIAVDACNNVYIGGDNAILSYNFNGNTFSALPSIPAGAASVNKDIYDIKLDEPTNLLYVSGSGFGGVYNAVNSSTCTQAQLTITPVCAGNNNSTAVATLTTTIVNPIISYSWTNSSNVVVSQTNNSTILTNTATNLANGNYTLFAQINAPCGPIFSKTFVITSPILPNITIGSPSTITCANPNVTLIGSSTTSGVLFQWIGGPTSSNYNVTTPGNYNLTVTDTLSGCSSTSLVSVTQNTVQPNISINVPPVLTCTNVNVNLQGNSTTPTVTYHWANGPASNNYNVSIAGNYNLTVTDPINGCSSTSMVTVTQNISLPNITIAVPPILSCFTTNVNLNGSSTTAGVTYQWTSGPASQNYNVTTAGNYNLTVTNPLNGCTSTSVVAVTQNTALPNITIAVPPVLTCAITNVNLNGSSSTAGVTYQWTGGPATQNYNVTAQGNYNLTVTDPLNGCSSSSVAAVTQNTTAPNISVSVSGSITCTNLNVNLTASSTNPLVSYQWINGPATASNFVTLPGPYNVTITDLTNGCTSNTVVTVTQNISVPNISATVSGSINCINTNVNLNGSSTTAGVSYQWTGGPSSSNYNVSSPGNYNLIVTDTLNGCSSSTAIAVASMPVLNSNINVLSQINCFGNNNGVLQLTNTSGIGPYTISNLNNANTISNISSFPINLSNLSANNYSIELTDNSTGCKQTLFASINQPNQLITALNGNTTVCEGQAVSISATINGGSAPYNYLWLPNNSNNQNLSVDANVTTNYTLTTTDNNGCTVSSVIGIVVHPKPNATLVNGKLSSCGSVCASFSLTQNQTSGYSYNWQFINAQSNTQQEAQVYNPQMCFTQAGSYNTTVTINTAQGCSTTVTYSNLITVYDKPNADFSFTPVNPSLLEPEVQFTNLSTGANQFSWYYTNAMFSNLLNPSYIVSDAGTFLVALIATKGQCADTALKQITIEEDYLFYIPNTFSPNGDNLNDIFKPAASGIKNYVLYIYNRWGEKLFTSNDLNAGWDGVYNGEMCKDDTYIWKVVLTTNKGRIKNLTGHVNLIK